MLDKTKGDYLLHGQKAAPPRVEASHSQTQHGQPSDQVKTFSKTIGYISPQNKLNAFLTPGFD